MLRMSLSARRKSHRGYRLAAALAAGAVIGTAALSTPALAQRQQGQQPAQSLSRDFQKVYQPVADIVTAGGDYASAKAQVPALVAAIKSEYDRFHAGNIIVQLGAKSSDTALQKQGLELMIASGQGAPADVGMFHYLLGGLSYDEQNYDGARQHLQAAIAAGYQGNFAEKEDPWGLIAESYFKQNRLQEGFDYLRKTIAERSTAGQEIRQVWLERPLALAYERQMAEEAANWSALMVSQSPSKDNWIKGLQVVNALSPNDPQLHLDLLRLMSLTNSMTNRREYENYIEAADARVMSNEVAKVLDAGVQAGVFTTGDPYYVETKRVVDSRAAEDRSEAPSLAAEARQASTGTSARSAGNVYLSLGEYAAAEEMFKLAIDKGGVDRDQMLTRLGIAQVQQGKVEEAKATFGQVSGTRAALARMWAAYAETRA